MAHCRLSKVRKTLLNLNKKIKRKSTALWFYRNSVLWGILMCKNKSAVLFCLFFVNQLLRLGKREKIPDDFAISYLQHQKIPLLMKAIL